MSRPIDQAPKQLLAAPDEKIDHPIHYGGELNPYEAIKVIEAWHLGFNLGNAVKYIARAEMKGAAVDDLRKASWYLLHEIHNRQPPTQVELVEAMHKAADKAGCRILEIENK